MKTIEEWFTEYGVSHQNATNKLIHWICVPLIFFSVVALLYKVKIIYLFAFEFITGIHVVLTLAHLALIAAAIFYFRLSWQLAIGTTAFAFICLAICNRIEMLGLPLGYIAIGIFIAAWAGQFYGHHIEGKKPSFLKDLQFLLIGPAWLLGFIYRKFGIAY